MLPGVPIDALSSSLIMRGQSTVQLRVDLSVNQTAYTPIQSHQGVFAPNYS
jgi:hypothetical protein